MGRVLPDVITHNFDPARGALLNICDLPAVDAEAILRDIAARGHRFVRRNYLEKRLATERWLLAERTRKLGPPRLAHPIYFFLGDFADGWDASRPQSIVLPLAAFLPEMLTFTYPDSMASLPLAAGAGRKPYHGQVFTLTEIEEVLAAFGLPDKQVPSADRFIEVQVWDDRPLEPVWARLACAYSR
jgi:hypothetical protein